MGKRLALIMVGLALAISACGPGETADPYTVLDRAVTVGWQQVKINVGFSLDVPAQQVDGLSMPGTAIHIDPSSLQATIDTQTGRGSLALSIPLVALGQQPSALGPLVQSLDAELLFDGAALFLKSPLLPLYLQGGGGILFGSPIEGDLTGWVRLGSLADFDKLGGVGGLLGSMTGFGPGFLGALPIPSAGSPAELQAFIEDFGVTVVSAGSASDGGVDTHHLTATIDLAKLAESRQLAAFTGFGRDQLQGVFDASKQLTATADLWVEKGTGRLRTFRLNARTLTAPVATVVVVIQLADPDPGTTFDAPATFTDVPLVQLFGTGIGFGSNNEGGATAAPAEPEEPGVETPTVP